MTVQVKRSLLFKSAPEAAEVCLGESKAGDSFQPVRQLQTTSPTKALQVVRFLEHFIPVAAGKHLASHCCFTGGSSP